MTSAVADEFKSGLWSGGYGALDSDRPQWTALSSRLTVDEGAFRGELQSGGEIEVRMEGNAATLSIKDGANRLKCAGTLSGETLIGGCTGGSQQLSFQLVRELDIPDASLEKLAGSYRDEKGNLFAVRKSFHLVFTDFQKGTLRVLYADGPNRFAAGTRLAVETPSGPVAAVVSDCPMS